MKPRRYNGVWKIRWFNPYTSPPSNGPRVIGEPEVVEDWANNSRPPSAKMRAMCEKAGQGYSIGWHHEYIDPPRRWSTEAKGRVRRKNLRKRLEKTEPLFAEILYPEIVAADPDYFSGLTTRRTPGIPPGQTPRSGLPSAIT